MSFVALRVQRNVDYSDKAIYPGERVYFLILDYCVW